MPALVNTSDNQGFLVPHGLLGEVDDLRGALAEVCSGCGLYGGFFLGRHHVVGVRELDHVLDDGHGDLFQVVRDSGDQLFDQTGYVLGRGLCGG